jgi:hypothetical protein
MSQRYDLDERPGKVVGRRTLPPPGLRMEPAQTIEESKARRALFGGIPVPRGVYRFRTHEEADKWLWEMLTRPRQ